MHWWFLLAATARAHVFPSRTCILTLYRSRALARLCVCVCAPHESSWKEELRTHATEVQWRARYDVGFRAKHSFYWFWTFYGTRFNEVFFENNKKKNWRKLSRAENSHCESSQAMRFFRSMEFSSFPKFAEHFIEIGILFRIVWTIRPTKTKNSHIRMYSHTFTAALTVQPIRCCIEWRHTHTRARRSQHISISFARTPMAAIALALLREWWIGNIRTEWVFSVGRLCDGTLQSWLPIKIDRGGGVTESERGERGERWEANTENGRVIARAVVTSTNNAQSARYATSFRYSY